MREETGFLAGQLLIDFDEWMRLLPRGWSYCPCAKPVSIADEPAFAEDAAGVPRRWHRACLEADKREQLAKRARKREQQRR